jgi:hypothetical protein
MSNFTPKTVTPRNSRLSRGLFKFEIEKDTNCTSSPETSSSMPTLSSEDFEDISMSETSTNGKRKSKNTITINKKLKICEEDIGSEIPKDKHFTYIQEPIFIGNGTNMMILPSPMNKDDISIPSSNNTSPSVNPSSHESSPTVLPMNTFFQPSPSSTLYPYIPMNTNQMFIFANTPTNAFSYLPQHSPTSLTPTAMSSLLQVALQKQVSKDLTNSSPKPNSNSNFFPTSSPRSKLPITISSSKPCLHIDTTKESTHIPLQSTTHLPSTAEVSAVLTLVTSFTPKHEYELSTPIAVSSSSSGTSMSSIVGVNVNA